MGLNSCVKMEDLILALIVKNENFRGEYMFRQFIARTNAYSQFNDFIIILKNNELIIISNLNSIQSYSATKKGNSLVDEIGIEKIITESEPFFGKRSDYENLKHYFK